jgi:uncharacterized damage-inducible protein DinB
MENKTEINLAPPGAGLPLLERLVVRWVVGPVISKRVPLKKCREDYEAATAKILERVRSASITMLKEPVLVDPMSGLEDSSRFWSVNQTLEHLLIVSKSIEGIILSLGSGKVPPGMGDPALVKPKNPDSDYIEEFSAYAPSLMERLDLKIEAGKIDINSKLKFPHAWFGPMTARQWYWLLSRHQGIHKKQITLILKGLTDPELSGVKRGVWQLWRPLRNSTSSGVASLIVSSFIKKF